MTLLSILVSIESRTYCDIYHGKLQGLLWKFWESALVRDSFMSFYFMRDNKTSAHNNKKNLWVRLKEFAKRSHAESLRFVNRFSKLLGAWLGRTLPNNFIEKHFSRLQKAWRLSMRIKSRHDWTVFGFLAAMTKCQLSAELASHLIAVGIVRKIEINLSNYMHAWCKETSHPWLHNEH